MSRKEEDEVYFPLSDIEQEGKLCQHLLTQVEQRCKRKFAACCQA